MAGDMADSIEWFIAYRDEPEYTEAATDFYSPCCAFGGVYADFEDGDLIGFRCAECNKGYDVSYKDEFET